MEFLGVRVPGLRVAYENEINNKRIWIAAKYI